MHESKSTFMIIERNYLINLSLHGDLFKDTRIREVILGEISSVLGLEDKEIKILRFYIEGNKYFSKTKFKPQNKESYNSKKKAMAKDHSQNKISPTDPILADIARGKLSKWATRLFLTDRPRGLIETTELTPINDTYLKAFGQRERESDCSIGRTIKIENFGHDEDCKSKKSYLVTQNVEKRKNSFVEGKKVKITNLSYNTTKSELSKKCEQYGPLLNVNLIMDTESSRKLNSGRAYITFESSDHADEFIQQMNENIFDNRVIKVCYASYSKKVNEDCKTQTYKVRRSLGVSRYWERDITTKCFRCREVGHIEVDCQNEEKLKPCAICAKTGHDSWGCPLSKICFNCGVPGHINRNCPKVRGIRKRVVCGGCFRSGHHRWQCKVDLADIPVYDAKCLVCGKLGHFMCTRMNWIFGLKGLSCYNCGYEGHHGTNCERPGLDVCIRDKDIALKEIQRAESFSIEREYYHKKSKRQGCLRFQRIYSDHIVKKDRVIDKTYSKQIVCFCNKYRQKELNCEFKTPLKKFKKTHDKSSTLNNIKGFRGIIKDL